MIAPPRLRLSAGCCLHLARGPLAEGPAAADTDATHPTPDGWSPVRNRSGGQSPIEDSWAATPRGPGDNEPRLRPDVVAEWVVEADTTPLYRQERTRLGATPSETATGECEPAPAATAPGDETQSRAPPETGPSARGHTDTEASGTAPQACQHSPLARVEARDQQTGTITRRALSYRFRSTGSAFRVDHCGWQSPAGSTPQQPAASPADWPGYGAGRDPVWNATDGVSMLASMFDDVGAPRADRARRPRMIAHTQLWQTLCAIRQTGQHPRRWDGPRLRSRPSWIGWPPPRGA